MRSSSGGENTVLAGTARKTYYRVDIADPVGTMQDMASFASYGWVQAVSIDEAIEQPIASCTITLRREINVVGGLGYTTLSPLRTDSPANPLGSSIAPYRATKVYVAVVTGSRPTALSTDWKLKFDGLTDSVEMENEGTIVVTCRDKGAYLIDQWNFDAVGSNFVVRGPMSLELMMNRLLQLAPVAGVILAANVPVDPGYQVRSFPSKFEPVMDALQRAAALAVCDFRFLWDNSSSAYKPTLTVPDRDSPSSAATFGSADVVRWQRLKIDRLNVRNVIIVQYRLSTSTSRRDVTVQDTASITLYGQRILVLQESDDSSIDSSAEATTMANLVLSDTKDPVAEAEVELLTDWRVELFDYLTFSPNKYFDIAQSFAVVAIRHELQQDRQRTFLTLRGSPSAGYRRWVEKAKRINPTNASPTDNALTNLSYVDAANATSRTWTWTRGDNVAFVAFYEKEIAAPVSSASYPDPDTVPALVASGTVGASILAPTTDTWTAARPGFGNIRIGMAVPFYKLGARLVVGEPLKFESMPGLNDDPKRAIVCWANSVEAPTTVTITLTVYDPSLFRTDNVIEDAALFQYNSVSVTPDACDADDLNDVFTATITIPRDSFDIFVQPYLTVCTQSMHNSARGLGAVGDLDHLKYANGIVVPAL